MFKNVNLKFGTYFTIIVHFMVSNLHMNTITRDSNSAKEFALLKKEPANAFNIQHAL